MYTDPGEPQCTALQTDGRTDDRMMPTADHTVQQYDRLEQVAHCVEAKR